MTVHQTGIYLGGSSCTISSHRLPQPIIFPFKECETGGELCHFPLSKPQASASQPVHSLKASIDVHGLLLYVETRAGDGVPFSIDGRKDWDWWMGWLGEPGVHRCCGCVAYSRNFLRQRRKDGSRRALESERRIEVVAESWKMFSGTPSDTITSSDTITCHSHSWPSSPPHWLSQKRNKAHVKPPRPFYLINFIGLYRSGGLMANMLVRVDGFSRTLASLVFESWSVYVFLRGSNFAFLCVIGYFLLPIGIYFALCSSLIFIWH